MSETTKSYMVEILAYGESNWSNSGLRFEKEEDATAYAEGLFYRWTRVVDFRVVPTQDAPTHIMVGVNAKAIE